MNLRFSPPFRLLGRNVNRSKKFLQLSGLGSQQSCNTPNKKRARSEVRAPSLASPCEVYLVSCSGAITWLALPSRAPERMRTRYIPEGTRRPRSLQAFQASELTPAS